MFDQEELDAAGQAGIVDGPIYSTQEFTKTTVRDACKVEEYILAEFTNSCDGGGDTAPNRGMTVMLFEEY